MGCIVSCVACCFCSAAASLCCSCLPSCKNSTSARIMYGLFLVIATIISCIMLSSGMEKLLKSIPGLCSSVTVGGKTIIEGHNCDYVIGFSAVYRISFGLVCFFFVLWLMMLYVTSSKDPRASIQNGFWGFKFLLLVAIIIAAFFIPSESFGYTWWIFGLIGGFLFILTQLILIIDFAHGWNETWLDAYDETDSKWYYCALLFFTILFYIGAIVGVVLMYVFFTTPTACSLNKFFISFNLILCVIISIISILPQVQAVQPRSGLLQASLISIYVIYLTWSSMSNEANLACNPTVEIFRNKTASGKDNETVVLRFDAETIIGLIVFFVFLWYACLRSSANTSVGRMTMAGNQESAVMPNSESVEAGNVEEYQGQRVWDNEEDGVAYSYSMFHFILLLGSFYMMMTLTSWYQPNSKLTSLSTSYISMWIKISSSWLCIAIYVWTLIAPIVLPDRDFS